MQLLFLATESEELQVGTVERQQKPEKGKLAAAAEGCFLSD